MKSFLKLSIFTILAAITSSSVFGRWVSEAEVRQAATETLAQTLFKNNFPNATIHAVVDLDGLWCVQLAPKGYLLFSGSTLQGPLLSYGTEAYVTPEAGHPALQVQRAWGARVKTSETAGKGNEDAEARWETLLNPVATFTRLRAVTEEELLPKGEVLEVNTNWNQCLPWNDFCPQIEAQAGTDLYYNRAPVGCVATMYSQLMKYYKWPARTDSTYINTLIGKNCALQDAEGKFNYEMRFKGSQAIAWDDFRNDYWKLTKKGWEPLFIKNAEAERLAIARVGLLVDVLTGMTFDLLENGGSGTTLLSAIENEWFELGDIEGREDEEDFTEEQLQAIKETIVQGMPIPAIIPEHAVLIYGYQEQKDQTFLKINYGWGNSDGSNTFYEANASTVEMWILNHCPKLQAQVTPLPKVIQANDEPTLTWSVPAYHEDEFTGFTLTATPYASDATALVDYKPSTEVLEDPNAAPEIYGITTVRDEQQRESSALAIKMPIDLKSAYLFPEAFIPTESSTFSCQLTNVGGEEALAATVKVQLWNDEDSAWTTLASFPEVDENGVKIVPNRLSIALGDYAERFCRLRLVATSVDDAEEDEEDETEDDDAEAPVCYAVNVLQISDVYASGAPLTWQVASDVREQTLTGLAPTDGARYRIQVIPQTVEAPVFAAETFTRVTAAAVETPVIEQVTNLANGEGLVNDTLLTADLDGRSGMRVMCNEAVAKLCVQSSCPTLIPDEAITLYRYGEQCFDVIIDSPQTVEALDGSRVILWLEARTAQGNVTSKEVVVALRAATPSIEYPAQWQNPDVLLDRLIVAVDERKNQAIVKGCSGAIFGRLEISAMLDGEIPVVAIADGAFKGQVGLTEVILPESITSIGKYAFSGCSYLKVSSIALPNQPKLKLGKGAFTGCKVTEVSAVPGEVLTREALGEAVGYKVATAVSGLKLNAKTGDITATFKKSGTYEAVLFKPGEPLKVVRIKVGALPTVTLTMADADAKCSVKGAGAYLMGKKVTLSAKASKEKIFLGFYDEADQLVSSAMKYTFIMGRENVTLVAKFAVEQIETGIGALKTAQWQVGKACTITLPVDADSGVKRVKAKLPSGLKVVKTKDGLWQVVGSPKKAGVYTVTLAVSTLQKQQKAESFTMTVAAEEADLELSAIQNATFNVSHSVSNVVMGAFATSEIKSIKASKLPSGMKVQCIDGVWQLIGAPKKAGIYNVKFTMVTKAGTKVKKEITLTVNLVPEWAAKVFNGEVTLHEEEDGLWLTEPGVATLNIGTMGDVLGEVRLDDGDYATINTGKTPAKLLASSEDEVKLQLMVQWFDHEDHKPDGKVKTTLTITKSEQGITLNYSDKTKDSYVEGELNVIH